MPPHALPVRKGNRIKFLALSFAFSTLFTAVFAFALNSSGIPVNVIIPSSAPIWIGTITIGYMVQVEK